MPDPVAALFRQPFRQFDLKWALYAWPKSMAGSWIVEQADADACEVIYVYRSMTAQQQVRGWQISAEPTGVVVQEFGVRAPMSGPGVPMPPRRFEGLPEALGFIWATKPRCT